MDKEAMNRLIRLAREANDAGDRDRVARCLDLLEQDTWNSAWDAVERDTRAAVKAVSDAAWASIDADAVAAATRVGKP